jgi:hypothetical protein
LWSCSDILPGSAVTEIEDYGGELKTRTYACAARWMKEETMAQLAKAAAA